MGEMEAVLDAANPGLLDLGEDENRPGWNRGLRVEVNGVVFYGSDEGIVAETEDGTMLICSTDFEVKERLVNPETGAAWYRIEVKADRPQEILVPIARGPAGIVRALQNAGQYVRPKQLTMYLEELLARNWHSLPVTSVAQGEEMADASPAAASIYELFLEFVRDNVDKFDGEIWGRIEEDEDGGMVFVVRPVMAAFLQKVGVPPEQWTCVLRYWREKGLLHVDGDRKRLTKRERINGVLRRIYAVSLPPDQQAIYEVT